MTARPGREVPGVPPRRWARLPRGWPDIASRAVVLLLSVWWLGLIAITAPHLVHHAFDADGGADCVFLDVAHHAPAASAAPVLALQLLPAADPVSIPQTPVRPRIPPASPLARGPPAITLPFA